MDKTERECLIGEPGLQFLREQFFGDVEPETLPPLDGPVTLKDGTVIKPRAKRGSVLEEAITTINGERQDVYGSPEDSFAIIADYWNVYLGGEAVGVRVNAQDVALMMTLFKIAREANQHKRDNILDAAGYLGIYADMQGEG
jgi:hypothetical protein